jgi:hypothetical protein
MGPFEIATNAVFAPGRGVGGIIIKRRAAVVVQCGEVLRHGRKVPLDRCVDHALFGIAA